jgi:hypothetical protein
MSTRGGNDTQGGVRWIEITKKSFQDNFLCFPAQPKIIATQICQICTGKLAAYFAVV